MSICNDVNIRDEGERLAVYGAEVCGELFNEAIRLDGVTGDRGVGGAAFQRSRQRRSAGGGQSTRQMAQSLRELESKFKNH
jgi:hypothetical protein